MPRIAERLDEFFSSFTPVFNKGLRENRVERMRLLLERLGNPEKTFRSIHIAGSKGKGTTATVMALMLKEMGKRCGLYMSPHVYDIRERFTLAGEFFSDEMLEATMEEVREKVEEFRLPEEYGPERPTTFELYTAFAYCLFRAAGCEYAVIETGLGGRLDATNTLDPLAAVITTIEMEHTQVLGNTLTEIATEKSGIMRRGVPTFILDQEKETLDVFEKRAKEEESHLRVFSFETRDWEWDDPVKMSTVFDGKEYKLDVECFEEVTLLDSFYALYVLHKLSLVPEKKNHFHITLDNGFFMPARYEARYMDFFNPDGYEETLMILDGAHTKASMKAFVDTLRKDRGDDGLSSSALIFSLAEDKDVEHITAEIFPYFRNIYVTTIGSWKKNSAERIMEVTKPLYPEKNIIFEENPMKALMRAARKARSPESAIIVTGSFYLCSEIDKAMRELGYGD